MILIEILEGKNYFSKITKYELHTKTSKTNTTTLLPFLSGEETHYYLYNRVKKIGRNAKSKWQIGTIM